MTRRGAFWRVVGIAAASVLVLSACGGSDDADSGSTTQSEVTVSDSAVGAVPDGSAAVYLTLDNQGRDDALTGASCDCGAEVSLHDTSDADGMAMMTPVEQVDLPAGESVELRPGGAHLMIEDLAEPLTAGSAVELTLSFETAPAAVVEVPVVPLDELAERVEAP